MIGEKIRRLRIARGLSQTQLAGNDMTRAFISQVEHGKCVPSPENLRLLAERLGKSVSYFLEDGTGEAETVRYLWELITGDVAAARWEAALPKLQQVVQLTRRMEDPEREAEALLLLGRCFLNLGPREQALDHLEEALERYTALGRAREVMEVCLDIGSCYFFMEQFAAARRYYEKVVRQSVGMKSAIHLRGMALCYLGATHIALGELSEAVHILHEGVACIDPGLEPVHWGRAAYGLGAAYRRLGKPELALDWNKQALSCLRQAGSPFGAEAEHNLALVCMDLGRWEEAYATMRRVQAHFREQGNAVAEARVMEDLFRYFLHKGRLDEAEQLCWQAIDLTQAGSHARLRGILYRDLAQVYSERGQTARARELLDISYELLRHVRSGDELHRTLEAIATIDGGANPPGTKA